MLGYKPNEFPANFENWVNLIHPDDREKALAVAEDYLKTKPNLYENEFRLRTSEGDYRWINTRARVVARDKNGDAVYLTGNHQDITERKNALDSLENKRSFLSAVLDNIEEAIVICNAEGQLIRFNESARRLHGIPEKPI